MSRFTAETRLGLGAALGAYCLWGLLPIYFHLLHRVAPDIMLAQRVFWSLPTGLLLVLIARRAGDVAAVLRDRRLLLMLMGSGALIGFNWLVYIWAVHNDRVLEASLGYYINPLFNFLFAALLFGERFKPLQLIAMVLACLGVLNQSVIVGEPPWVALALCLSFAAYSIIRRQALVDSRVGFLMEVMLLAPVAIIYLGWNIAQGGDWIAQTPFETGLVIASGAITAAPLILFSLAAKRLQFSTIGIMQYIGPTLQLVLALLYGEAFTAGHAVTFGLIWAGVVLFSISAFISDRGKRAQPSVV